jgi:hypothetical protein
MVAFCGAAQSMQCPDTNQSVGTGPGQTEPQIESLAEQVDRNRRAGTLAATGQLPAIRLVEFFRCKLG